MTRTAEPLRHIGIRLVICAVVGISVSIGSARDVRAEKPHNFWSSITKKKAPSRRAPSSGVGASEVVPLSADCEAIAKPYKVALGDYIAKSSRYWAEIDRKKKLRRKRRKAKLAIRQRDYVMVHPPAYVGPKRPKCLDAGKPTKTVRPKSTLPLVSDFLHAARTLYGFVPRKTTELAYKRTFAREAIAVGLTAKQVVGVYALETGGIGPYDRQSGIFIVDQKCKPIAARGRAASTALSYAQLLSANSAIMTHDHGRAFAARLDAQARTAPPWRAKELRKKAKMLRRMARDVAIGHRRAKGGSSWRKYIAFSKTKRGQAVHALLLDPDIGPLLQVYKLKRIVDGAVRRGFRKVSAAQLELMNLAGPGTGLEMMTPVGSKAPTSNFFSRGGYQRNPVSKNRTAKGLLLKIAERIDAQMGKCGSKEFLAAFRDVQG